MEPNTIIAITAVLLSIATLVLTGIWNQRIFKMTEKHNKLSVRPLIDVYIDHNPNRYVLFLKNVGMGPGIIRTIHFSYRGEEFKDLYDLVYKVTGDKLKWLAGHYSIYQRGHIIGQGQQLVLFESSATKPDLEMISSALDGIRMYLTYADIYNGLSTYDDFMVSNLKKIDPDFNIRIIDNNIRTLDV